MSKHRAPRRPTPASINLIDICDPGEVFTQEEIDRARIIVRSLNTAAFAGVDLDRTVALAVSALRS